MFVSFASKALIFVFFKENCNFSKTLHRDVKLPGNRDAKINTFLSMQKNTGKDIFFKYRVCTIR